MMRVGKKECTLKYRTVTKTSGNPTVKLNIVPIKIIEKICKVSIIMFFGHLLYTK